MVPTACVIFVADLSALTHHGTSGADGVLRTFGAVLALLFYAVLIWCYLRRGPAVATSGSITAHLPAGGSPLPPFPLPPLPSAPPGPSPQAPSPPVLRCGAGGAGRVPPSPPRD